MPELEVEETVDALSLLVTENEQESDTGEDEDEAAELPTTIEGLTALLEQKNATISKRNKSLKKAKSAQHRTQDENNTLQSQFEALEAKIDGIGKPNVEAENLAAQEQEWQDRVDDDPTQVMAYMKWKLEQQNNNLSGFLGQKFGEFNESLSALSDKTNPELLEHKAAIETVRSNPEFADLDDDMLLKVAKVLKKAKVKTPRGGIGGNKIVPLKPKSPAYELSEEDKQRMGWG
jgi:DNA repair exonuclease SbcCD ATPase subunit